MTRITVRSTEREQILDITPQMRAFAAKAGAKSGLLAVYCPHTTAAISANENADPDVKSGMLRFMRKLVGQSHEFKHAEDNAEAHCCWATGRRSTSWNSTGPGSVRYGSS